MPTLAEQVRRIARENELLAYTSAGDPKDIHASRRYALHAGILYIAANALDGADDGRGLWGPLSRGDDGQGPGSTT